jgi:excinuclease ABC subunit B
VAWRAVPDAPRHHRLGQVRDHRRGRSSRCSARRSCWRPTSRLGGPAGQRVPRVLPRQPVEYFVSYYDYYQPEAYIASSDTYIEKDSTVNDEIDRLRHAATSALLTRRDVIVVASVSCIYGLGHPRSTRQAARRCASARPTTSGQVLRRLVAMQYERNEMNLIRGKFRVKGDVLEIHPAYDETAVRIELFGDEIESIWVVRPAHRRPHAQLDEFVCSPPPTTPPPTSG